MMILGIAALGIGFVAGLRSLTAPAVVCWAAYLGWLDLTGSPLAFIGSIFTVVVVTALALGEYVGDVLPKTPRRTMPGPLIARFVTGGLSGACLFVAASRSPFIGVLLGGGGAILGAFAGFEIRRRLVDILRVKDIFIAIPEDLVALGLGLLIVATR
jgi:uncharacterized membrane protein